MDHPAFIPPYPDRPPQRLPTLQLLRRSRQNLLAIFDDTAFDQDLMSLQVLNRRVFICNSPDTVRHALVTANASFERKSPQMRHALRPLLGDGLFISDGETWATRRRIVGPIIHGSHMPDFAPLMVEAASETAERWAARLARGENEIDAAVDMAHLTAEIICRTIFGRALGQNSATAIIDGFRTYQNQVSSLDVLSLLGLPEWFPRLQAPAIYHAVRRIKATLDAIIDAYQQRPEPREPSLIGMLLDARKPDGTPLDREVVRNEAAVIFMAGHETTANCLAWAWYLLSQSPETEARLHAELDSVLGPAPPSQADLPNLPYTRAVIDETLRLYPPVPFLAREAAVPETLRRRPVPAGSLIMVVLWLLHRHRKHWDQPDAFIPERFLPGAALPDRNVYIPFSTGPRVCAGLTFGHSEAILCLAILARRFRLALKPGTTVEPVCHLTLGPGERLPMLLHARAG